MAESSFYANVRWVGWEVGWRFMILVSMFLIGFVYWNWLTAIQALIIPDMPGGTNGPWLIRPDLSFHFGATAVLFVVTVVPLARLLQQLRQREDNRGKSADPGADRRRRLLIIKGNLLGIFYVVALGFSLLSWTVIEEKGIQQRLPWTTRSYSYADITELECIPDGEWNESAKQKGPWYKVKFKSGQILEMSLNNEGETREELSTISKFIADRSGREWAKRADARRE